MKNFVVIKAGSAFPNTVRSYGDFEDWTCRGLGLARENVRIVDAIRGDSLPPAPTCDGVVVTGSHSMVTDEHDWSERLVEWIAELVDEGVPFLGICYGHQLLAKAAGGTVGYHSSGMEIGTVDIELLSEGSTDGLLKGLPTRFPVHVTHSQTVIELPGNATRLAANSFENTHVMRVGACAWGVQFHPEYRSEVMRSYIDEQADDLEAAGIDLAVVQRSVRETREAASILRRFAELCEQRSDRA